MSIKLLKRTQINNQYWDACVAASNQPIVYGYSWYMDAVTSINGWKWVGLVSMNEQGDYMAVMPVPLRRKYGFWVVHQPLFCQFLDVFSQKAAFDSSLFFLALQQRFWYGSIFYLRQNAGQHFTTSINRPLTTLLLDLSQAYETIYAQYTPDRRRNLRLAQAFGWTIRESANIEPMLALFRQYHAEQIPGGVGEWAYVIFRNLVLALQQRGMARLHYAVKNESIEAGALFVQAGNRVIYLFNAASFIGRKGNARTLLIDQCIREQCQTAGCWFDFECPEEESIASFYRSFGAVEEKFWAVRWRRKML